MRIKLKVVSSEITNVITNVISNDVTGVAGNIMEEKKDSADMTNKPPVFPLQVKVEHQGFWVTVDNKHVATTDPLCSRNSVMLQPTCLLSLWKLAFRHSLISKGFLTVDDLDAANLVPHIRVRKDPSDGFSHYEDVKRTYLLSREHFSSRKDFLTIELDIKKNLHFTLVYSKGIGGKMNLLSAFEETMRILNNDPNLVDQYTSLPYFGEQAASYWQLTKDKYPTNIVPPTDFKIPPLEEPPVCSKVSPAGTVLL